MSFVCFFQTYSVSFLDLYTNLKLGSYVEVPRTFFGDVTLSIVCLRPKARAPTLGRVGVLDIPDTTRRVLEAGRA